jgi:hypothetical protein
MILCCLAGIVHREHASASLVHPIAGGPMVSEVIGPVAGRSVNTEGENSPR